MPRFFAATASSALRVMRSSFRSTADSLHLSAERASTPLAASDAPCRAFGASRGFHLPTGVRFVRRRCERADRARTVGPASLLRLTRSPPETPLVGSIRCRHRMAATSDTNGLARTLITFDTLSRAAVTAGPSRSRPPRRRYSWSCHPHTRCGRPVAEKMSLSNLCNRISCHEHPGELTLSDLRLAPCGPPLRGPPRFAGCSSSVGTIPPSARASNSREGISDPSGAAFGTARAS